MNLILRPPVFLFFDFRYLRQAYETLQRKINAVENIEVEIIDISNDEKLIEDIIIDELLLMNLRSKQNQNWLL